MTSRIDRREFLISSGVSAGLAAVAPNLPADTLKEEGEGLRVVGLKVDYLDCALGLENPRPCLSWRLESSERNIRQSAYRILVASREDILESCRGDLWDSGIVHSRKSFGVQY